MIVQSENWWLYRDVTRQTNNCSVWSAFESVLSLWWWTAHLRRNNFCHRNTDSSTRTTASPRPQWLACSTLARWVLRIRVVSVHDGSVWQRQLCHAAGRSLYGLPLLGWDLDAICGVITGTLDLESQRFGDFLWIRHDFGIFMDLTLKFISPPPSLNQISIPVLALIAIDWH